MWVRAKESGFVFKFQIYTTDRTIEQNLDQRVVTDLTRELVGKHQELYIDNFFNSVELQLSMQKDDIYLCGTARPVRKGFSKDLVGDKLMKRGDSDWRVSDSGIVAVKWKDKKAVHFLSNFHNPKETELISRRQKDGTRQEFNSIKLVKDYNAHMGYVDKSDMYKYC